MYIWAAYILLKINYVLLILCHYELFTTNHIFFDFSSEEDKLDMKTMKEMRDCIKKVGKSGIETTAYLHALGESKGLNVDKYRHQVQKELEKDC